MTEEEAALASREHPATLSVMLRFDGQRHGVLYIDCVRENEFGKDRKIDNMSTDEPKDPDATDVARTIERHPATVRLARAVGEVLEPLRLAAPFLELAQ
jgi:hypothetical protein